MKFEYSDEVFEQIIRVMKDITGECWYDIFGANAKLIGGNSESDKLLEEYFDSHEEIIMDKGDFYTPHLLEWLIIKKHTLTANNNINIVERELVNNKKELV
jgi:hypothetical protein